ncbi:MAG: acyltransferase family protein [Bacteroidaceae bacterium]|nr:acyltransferase family protein [Bacteroidaceae bacterium]
MKARQSNFEILRIVSMLAVVAAHYISWGTSQYGGPVKVCFLNGGINSYVYPFLESFASIGVPCFVMITGYFISGSRVLRFDRILKVWVQTLFYSVAMVLVSSMFIDVCPKDILMSFAPIGSNQYWFVTKYVALILLAPVLFVITDTVSKKGMQAILAILAFLTVTVTCGIPYGNKFFDDSPFSVAVFVLYFFIAAYIRKYDVPAVVVKYSAWIFMAGIMCQGLGGVGMNLYLKPETYVYGGFSTGYNAFTVVPATALFIWFRNHSFKNSRLTELACRFAPYTFAAYLIHDNRYFRQVLWRIIFNPGECWQSPKWTLYAVAVPVVIVLVAGIIDMLRERLFSVCGVDRLVRKIGNYNLNIE